MPKGVAAEGLALLSCADCGWLGPGPREFCHRCLGERLRQVRVSGCGRLLSWTVIRRPPTAFADRGPYAVAVIEVAEGARLIGRLDDAAAVPAPGSPVRYTGLAGSVPTFAVEHR